MAPVPGRDGALHGLAPKAHERDRGPEIERAGGDQGAVFAEAVAGQHVGPGAAAAVPGAPDGDAGRQHRRLGAFGLRQPLFRALLAECPEVVAEHGRRLAKGLADDRLGRRERRQHAHGLRALAREHHRQLQWSSPASGMGGL